MNIRTKLLLMPVILGVVFITALSYSYMQSSRITNNVREMSSSVIKQIQEDSILPLMRLVESMSLDPMIDQEPEALNIILYNLRMHSAITSAVILDTDEYIFADGVSAEDNDNLGEPLSDEEKLDVNPDETVLRIHGQQLVYSKPFVSQGESIGRLQVIFSLKNLTTMTATLVEEAVKETEKSQSQSLRILLGCIVVISLTIILISYIANGITTPLRKVLLLAQKISEGDLTAKVTVKNKDELGDMAANLNSAINKLRGLIASLTGSTVHLANSSDDLSNVSTQMASSAEEMSTQTDTVASSTEEMSVNIDVIASSTEEMSVNIQNISSAAEQVSQNMNAVAQTTKEVASAINNVAVSAKEGSEIAEKATELSSESTETMSQLKNAAKEIGNVTDLIKQIADQTKLLSLNATIEAAAAGDAGRGFAVVAAEVKELARQSALAADNISTRIKEVQVNSENAVAGITNITDIIKKMNSTSSVITQSIAQQTANVDEIFGIIQQANSGTNNIAASIAEIAKGSNDMASSSAEAAKGASEVSKNIQGVRQAAGVTSSGARKVSKSAKEVDSIAGQIKEMAEKFKV